MNNSYPLKTSDDEIARLRMQADLFRGDAAGMLDQLGVEPGWRCLDMCCGVGGIVDLLSRRVGPDGAVTGVDLDQAKLAVARDWAAANGYANVRFEQADAFASGLAEASFDLVHCRFAMSVIPDGVRMLDPMLRLARPGGVVFVEEVNLHTMQCVPADPVWDRALAAMKAAFAKIGANVYLGADLYRLFHDRGLADIRIRPRMHALTADQPMTFHLPRTLEAMRDALLSLGLLSAAELDAMIAHLDALLAKPDTLTISYSMIQAAARVPG